MAIGLSQYNVALMHTVNHAFFVWQHRHFHFKYGPDLKNIFNEHIRTSIWSKFKLYLRWERLTKVNSYQNCNNVIEKFYSKKALGASDEIFIQEKINKGPRIIIFVIILHHIMNKCRIERILPSYNNIYCKIMKMLKVGKQNLLNKYLRICDFFNLLLEQVIFFLLGYKFCINTNINIKFSELLLMNDNNEIIKNFKRECKDLFKLNKTQNKIIFDLSILINKYISLKKKSYRFKNLMKNYIHNRSWIWAIKKHKKVGKNIIYKLYFKNNKFNLFKNDNNLNNLANIQTSNNDTLNDILNLANLDLKFINVEKEYKNIIIKLNSLSSGGIYLFWLLDDSSKCYIGSAINLKKRFMVHYNNSLKNNNHPKFYNCVKKYGWYKFGFIIIELEKNKSILIEKENIWLKKIYNDQPKAENILNILKLGNNWLNNKHNEKTKNR
jgi:hypothetical protein